MTGQVSIMSLGCREEANPLAAYRWRGCGFWAQRTARPAILCCSLRLTLLSSRRLAHLREVLDEGDKLCRARRFLVVPQSSPKLLPVVSSVPMARGND